MCICNQSSQTLAGPRTEERTCKCTEIQEGSIFRVKNGYAKSCTAAANGEGEKQKSFLCYARIFAN